MGELDPNKRLELHALLVALITAINSTAKVYFQPPSSIRLTYPCIIYETDGIDTDYADSIRYRSKRRYSVTLIDSNPDSLIPQKLLELQYCSFNRFFTADNLNHFVFTIYY